MTSICFGRIKFDKDNKRIMLKFDLHTHTIASGHAFNTVFELAQEANTRKMDTIAVTDHGPSMEGASHSGYFEMLEQIPKKLYGINIIAGCESNIIDVNGKIDLPSNLQNNLDLVIAGLHKRTPFPEETAIDQNTDAIINAIKKNHIHIISHPYRLEFPVDIKKVYKFAVEYNVLLELNLSLLDRYHSSKKLLDQVYLMIKLTKENNRKITVSSDCHISTRLGNDSILKHIKLEIPPELILGGEGGCQEIQDFLKSKK